jgi:homotetrameric cytidine deaminase
MNAKGEHESLLAAARAATKRAYAPYSGFRVGAAVLTEAGTLVTAVNVENASYGLTICAERAAIAAAVAQEGPGMRIRAIAVVTADEVPASPCGACRQVISEFGPNATVLFQGADGIEITTSAELLPHGFMLPPEPRS